MGVGVGVGVGGCQCIHGQLFSEQHSFQEEIITWCSPYRSYPIHHAKFQDIPKQDTRNWKSSDTRGPVNNFVKMHKYTPECIK